MQIQVNKADGNKILKVEGRIDTITAPEFEKKLLEEMKDSKSVQIDLEQVVYVSSAGLRAFLNGQKYANKNRIDMSLCNVAHTVIEVLEMTGFIDILTVE